MKIIKILSLLLFLLIFSSTKGNAQSSSPMLTIKPKLADSLNMLTNVDPLRLSTPSTHNSFVKKMDLNNQARQPVAIPNGYIKSKDSSISIPTAKIKIDTH